MQRIFVALWACLLVCLVFSCTKNNDVQSGTDRPKPVGEVTPVGTPDTDPLSQKTIGPDGGTIASSDGRLKLTIPAGALSSSQEVSIQSISNNNPLAVGQAYRIEPHNVRFSKQVIIEFSYNSDDIKNTIPEALGIAYQDAKGIWQAQGGIEVDKVNKTLKVTTNHFSDWSLFESFYLISSGPIVSVNGTIQLEVFTNEDLLAPLTLGEEMPIGKKTYMATAYIKEWKLAGAGELQSNGANAVYKAPSTVPGAPNPVAVSVSLDLKKHGKFLLVQHIEVVDDDGEIEIRVAGNAWVKKTASPAVKMGNNLYAIADSDGDTQGSYVLITWEGGKGTHAYKSPEDPQGTYVHYLVTGSNNYVCHYMNAEDDLVASGGGVTITSMGEEDGFIKGTFTITPAGYGDFLKNTIDIEGKFRVKKGW